VVKTCLKCNDEKPTSDFYQFFDKWAGKHYYSARCKPCHLQQKKENPNQSKNTKNEKLKLRYGLTYEDWEKIRTNENFSCMICGITEDELGKVLDVDHCHSSGKARGVLCNPCNTMLGRAKDNPEILKAAVKYLETHAGGYVS
jgi:hypothetical protein